MKKAKKVRRKRIQKKWGNLPKLSVKLKKISFLNSSFQNAASPQGETQRGGQTAGEISGRKRTSEKGVEGKQAVTETTNGISKESYEIEEEAKREGGRKRR